MRKRPRDCAVIVPLLIGLAAFSTAADEPPEYVDSWFLARVAERLTAEHPGGGLALVTGLPAVDAAIAESGIRRIDPALPVATRLGRNPEALARHGLDRTYRFHVPAGADIHALVDRFAGLPGVDYAEPDYYCQGDAVPDDPLFTDQWNLDQPSDADVDAPEGWDVSIGNGVVVAVMDTGVDSDHPEFVGRTVPGYDFINDDADPEDDGFHGTTIGSIAVANTDNAEGLAGVCWNCKLMPVKIFDETVFGPWSVVADGMIWIADSGVKLVNFSGSAQGPSQTAHDALRYAYEAGVLIFIASGNGATASVGVPARYWESVAVGGSNGADGRYGASNWGPEIDLVAPGTGVPSAVLGGTYDVCWGTSCSAPHVAAVAGIMHAIHPSLGREETRHLLRSGAEDQVGAPIEDTEGRDHFFGWGRLNLDRTIRATAATMTLRVDGNGSTRLFFEEVNPLADSWDFIRGDLDSLVESPVRVDLGAVVCLENDSPDPDTSGNEDTAIPDPGKGFFYLARFNADSWAGSYGGSSGHRDRESVGAMPARILESDEVAARFGSSVGSAGDVNGDGYDDVIIGASAHDLSVGDGGAAFVYLGSAAGLEATPHWSRSESQSESDYGASVASAGDVNGDGYDDVIVGAPAYDNGQPDEGAVFVHHGSASGLSGTADWTAEGDQTESFFGFRVRSAGDVDGDGYDDVIIGAYEYTNGQNAEGRAFFYRGSASGLKPTPTWTLESDQPGAQMGAGVDGAGDVNGDGYDDLIVGAPSYGNGETNEGRAYVYHGKSVSGPGSNPPTPAWIAESDTEEAQMGYSVAGAGDVNDDGYDDVIVGAWSYGGPEAGEGRVWVYHGSETGLADTPAWSFESDQRGAYLGFSVDGAGDLNGDGYDDVIVGGESYHLSWVDEGRVWVFFGSDSGLADTPAWSEVGWQPDARFGWSVAGAGDVDGDGFDEIAVGAVEQEEGQFDEGRAYVHSGSSSGLPPVRISACDETTR